MSSVTAANGPGADLEPKEEKANAPRLIRTISDFCRVRLAGLMPPRDVARVRAYLLKLIEDGAHPPRRQSKFAFGEISRASGVAIPPKAMAPIALALDAIGGAARCRPQSPTPTAGKPMTAPVAPVPKRLCRPKPAGKDEGSSGGLVTDE